MIKSGEIIWKGEVLGMWKKKRFSVQVVLHTGAGKLNSIYYKFRNTIVTDAKK